MTAQLPWLGAWLLCCLMGCTRSDTVANSHANDSRRTPARSDLPIEGELPALDGATTWLNSRPLTPAGLRGKVVLIQFWTYTCINWRRTMPSVRDWAEKYAAAGLVVVGVHTPEFEFEKDIGNVRTAARETEISFPIAVDSQRAIWNAFGNEYWPALYFVDARGRIRHHQFGEGEDERSETIIRELLTDAGATDVARPRASVAVRGPELPADWADLRSPETYLGVGGPEDPSSPFDEPGRRPYPEPEPLALNQWALTGVWRTGREAVVLERAGGRIVYRFHARDLHLVMGPSKPTSAVRFRVRIDGQLPGKAHGVDVDEQGNGTVREPRMYQLIRQSKPIIERDFQIEFFDAPVEVYSFTFG